MQACPFLFLRDGQRHVVCLTGGGGKTTVMQQLAAQLAAAGRRVLLCTSTHIWQPKAAVYAKGADEARRLWQKGSYAVIGTPEPLTGKLTAPAPQLYAVLAQESDFVLCEADGAKHLPCKVPAAHEPVLLPDCDIVLAVVGMDALGRTLAEACFRPRLAQQLFAKLLHYVIDEQFLAQLLLSPQGARKDVGARAYHIVLNKCDLVPQKQALQLKSLLLAAGIEPERLWLRARPPESVL